MSQTPKEQDTFEAQLTLNKDDELSLLKKETLRCQVPSNKEFLQLLHEKSAWIPGAENIRPAPKAKEDKVEYLNNIQFNYESGKDYVYDSVFGCKTKKNEEGKLYVKNKDSLKKTVFCANLFPYQLPMNTKHYVIWYSGYKNNSFTKKRITSDIDLKIKNMVKHNNYDFVWYLNPKMTVPNVPHVQVFWVEDKNAISTKKDTHEETKSDDTEEKKMFDSDVLGLSVHRKDDRVRISITSPPLSANLDRNPVVVCCVVDVSGSMNTNATIKGEQNDGMTILDLVKHSIKTIIHCLSEKDYVSIVSYSDKAKVESILCRMTKGNRAKTLAAVEGLEPQGCTNLWDGLLNGLETLRNNEDTAMDNISNTNCAVLLFTDGLPNVNPPKGELVMLENYIDENGLICTINTYGFGYSLNTDLLNEIALRGNGTFSFIPDSSFVGTIFVNSISNFAANAAKNVILKIESNNKQYECEVIGGYQNIDTSWGVQINLGNLQYGQNKDIVLQFKSNQAAVVEEEHEGKEGTEKKLFEVDKNSLNYISLRNGVNIKCAAGGVIEDDGDDKLLDIHYYRLLVCDTLRMCMKLMKRNDMNDAQKQLKNLLKEIESNKKLSKNKYVKDLIKDLEGQAFEAISTTVAHNKWGKHYLPSLIFAHLHQYNSNFKDPGVQHYGGKLFNDIRDKADKIFIKLPLTVRVRNVQSNKTNKGKKKGKKSKSSTYSKPKPVNMANYYNASGVCFYGNCNVLMNDFSLKAVKNLCVNDIVSGGAKIKCVLKYECEDNKIILSTIGSLKITPFHPILMNNEWVFPNDVCNKINQKEEYIEDGYVYNFVLDTNHILNVNGIQCCTLGHGFNQNSVIYHQYFGTDRVIDDLKKFNGWKNGEIILSQCQVKRDLNSNLVNKIQL